MLSTLPKKFLATGDCGCGTPQSSAPIIPCVGARVCDDAYLGLSSAEVGQLLMVPQGSNCQAFLKKGTNFKGFVFYINGNAYLVDAPSMTLPLLNPPVSGNYPAPDPFKFLAIGQGDPADWKHVAAPSTGSWILQAKNGSWVVVDAGTIPGINEIGQAGLTTVKGKLMSLVEVSPSVWAVRTIVAAHNRVVVGDIDGGGVTGHKTLPDATALTHPLAAFQALQNRTYETTNLDGTPVAGGLELANVVGIGAVMDAVRVCYSPSLKRFLRAPDHTYAFVPNNTITAAFTPGVSFSAMLSGHGAGVARTYSYPNVRIDFSIYTNADENFIIGLFRDGSLLQEWSNTSVTDNYNIFYVDTAVVPGTHTYEFRIRKASGTNALIVRNSFFMVQTLP